MFLKCPNVEGILYVRLTRKQNGKQLDSHNLKKKFFKTFFIYLQVLLMTSMNHLSMYHSVSVGSKTTLKKKSNQTLLETFKLSSVAL